MNPERGVVPFFLPPFFLSPSVISRCPFFCLIAFVWLEWELALEFFLLISVSIVIVP